MAEYQSQTEKDNSNRHSTTESATIQEEGQLPSEKSLQRQARPAGRPLTPSAIVALQRTVGNQAVRRLLHQSGKPPTQQRRSTPSTIKGGPVQRRIGFEFETTDYTPYIHPTGQAQRPAARKEVLHQGTQFNLEGDDSTGASSPSIEFVTSAYDITKAGRDNLDTSMSEIKTILSRIEKFAQGTLILSNQHHLSNQDVELKKQESKAVNFKMQVTQGSSLEDLPTLMKYFGTNVPGETPKEAKQRKHARNLMVGKNQPGREETDLLGRAPSLAQAAIDYIATNRVALGLSAPEASFFEGNQPRLLGLFAQILMNVKGFSIPIGQLMKYKVPFLGRVEFSALFQELSNDHQKVLRRTDALAFRRAIVHAANTATLWPGDNNYTDNGALLRTAHIITGDNINAPKQKLPVMQSLTITEWLKGMTQGHDYLSAGEMDQWLQNNEAALDANERAKRTDLLESFNMLGPNVGTATDPADRANTSGLSVLENRAISPSGRFVNISQVNSIAKAYINFMLNLKTKQGAPGKFPSVKVPK